MDKGRLFGGIRDSIPPPGATAGVIPPFGWLRDVLLTGYVGTTGELGFLDILDKLILSRSDRGGYARNRAGLWRRNHEQFTVFSLRPQVLAAVTPQLRFVEAERPAQFRLHIGDVTQARMTPLLNAMGYNRTRKTSLGNIRLMHALDQQLHVPPEHCKDAAELLMDAKLICPLGGEYVFRKTSHDYGRWTSMVLEQAGSVSTLRPQPPAGYQAPPLNWFRGLDMDAVTDSHTISAHAEVIMQMPK